jgi:hypothetical protein
MLTARCRCSGRSTRRSACLGLSTTTPNRRSLTTGWKTARYSRRKNVRAAAERQAKRITEEAVEHGVELDVVDISAQMEQIYIYSALSDVSHVRRSGLRGMVSVPLRRAVYRAHPDPVARAHATVSTVLAVEATILGVGDALAAFYGGPCPRSRNPPQC